MLSLNSETLRDFLGDVFFDAESKSAYMKYIMPLQGNWWAPTEQDDETISTWIGYTIVTDESYLRARDITNETGHVLLQTMLAKVHLQFIGKDAERLAKTVMFWDERQDVADAFHRFAGQLMYEKRRIIPTPYYQDGQNSTLVQNIDFRFLHAEVIDPKQVKLVGVELGGEVIV